MIRLVAIACMIVFVTVGAVDAQGAPSSSTPGQLVLEPIHSPLIVAGDYKVTDIDGDVGHMAGVRAGRLLDDVLFAGGVFYWLPDGPNHSSLAYGGALL